MLSITCTLGEIRSLQSRSGPQRSNTNTHTDKRKQRLEEKKRKKKGQLCIAAEKVEAEEQESVVIKCYMRSWRAGQVRF